jgi:hypothetical protein
MEVLNQLLLSILYISNVMCLMTKNIYIVLHDTTKMNCWLKLSVTNSLSQFQAVMYQLHGRMF